MEYVTNFRDLEVYKASRSLSKDIFEITKRYPKEEKYSLTDQIRRASRSVGGQIAEAWAKRRYENHFLSKLTDADGEQLETQHWIETSLDCGYLTEKESSDFLERCKSIGKMLGKMMDKSSQFCKSFKTSKSVLYGSNR